MTKYKLSKSQLKVLFSTADMLMAGNYHELYKKLGWQQGANKNFHCFNSGGHAQGADVHASLSVNNQTGQWFCHTCSVKGNFQSYWRDYLKGAEGGDHYSDFIIGFLDMNTSANVHFSTDFNDPENEKWNEKLYKLYEQLQKKRKLSGEKTYILTDQLAEMARETASLPMAELDGYVESLLNDQERLTYLKETRGIDKDLIQCFRIGLDKRRRYIFPIINEDGDLLNMKVYDPFNKNKAFKWLYLYKDREIMPTPINNFTKNPIMFFAGEPDMYCAIAHGYEGAVTMGAEKNTDVNKIFGHERARQLFAGKEIIIVLDADETGQIYAQKLAHSLYPYAKQIKVIDLNKSKLNPYGLDPTLMKDVTVNGKTKQKRVEKDYTNFWIKNEFGELAKKRFDALIKDTNVYTENIDRIQKELYKVTLQESRLPKYSSYDGHKELELIASVGDFNDNAYHYPEQFAVSCPHTGCPNSTLYQSCKKCIIPKFPEFRDSREMNFNLVRDEIPKEHINNPGYVQVNAHEILGLVEVSETNKTLHLKRMCGISPYCQFARIVLKHPQKLLHVRLTRDIAEYGESFLDKTMESSAIEMDAYILGDTDIYPNKSYRFKGIQTQAFNDSRAVLFVYKTEPIATSVENFKMDQDTHDMLKMFQPKNENIEKHLERRYEVYSHAAGVTGRKEMFLINDLAFFSPTEISNKKLFPTLRRGWVEILIGGDTRCCKTMISQFLMNYYKVGELVAGSSAVTRSGLLGGTKFFRGKPGISWGKIPMNDGGIIIVDELSNIDQKTLTDLTPCRSSGVASVDTVAGSKRVPARTRKIFLSNARAWTADKAPSFGTGMRFLKNLCFKDEILSRFDLAWVVRQGDVDPDKFASAYRQPLTEFTEFQCRHLIMWALSRHPEDIIFEDGIEEHINNCQKKMLIKFHSSTQLVNQEIRLKITRLATALATMLYSTLPDDWNKVYVKKEHVDFIMKFLIKLYCHPNMRLDLYSKQQRGLDHLGSMKFMENVAKYIDLSPLLLEEEFTDKSLQQIFCDYLQRVASRDLLIVDAKNDESRSTGIPVIVGIHKLINILIARKCLIRAKGVYRKTDAFNKWLSEIMERKDDRLLSNILETTDNETDPQIFESIRGYLKGDKSSQSTGTD